MFSCNEFKRSGNEAAVAFLGILGQNFSGRTEETRG
jgi:hypothetical protein